MTNWSELTKAEWKVAIKELLLNNDTAVERALVRLYECQTADEQTSGETHDLNGVGFTGPDAYILSSFAKQVSNGRHLSNKQMAIARKRSLKYWRQLMEMASC